MRLIDLTGKTFGSLTVLGRDTAATGAAIKWLCRCVCGKTYGVAGQYLRSGAQTSCGCQSLHDSKLRDLTGERFGRLTVLERAGSSKGGQARWRCRCDCGGTTVALGNNLRRGGHTLSCGCVHSERSAAAGRERIKHGDARTEQHTAEYRSWCQMWRRCRNPKAANYAIYGGRGITVCMRWERYEAFLEDMGRKPSARHTLDRKDSDGNYTPRNCRWATPVEQARNRTITHMVMWRGRRMPLAEACELEGKPYRTVKTRLRVGWPLDAALTGERYRHVNRRRRRSHGA